MSFDLRFLITPLISSNFSCRVTNKGNNNITELRTILQRESQNSKVYKQTKSVNNRKIVKTMQFHIVKMYKDKGVNKNVKNMCLSMCDVQLFLTFASLGLVLL